MKTGTTIRRPTPADGFLIEALTRRIWTGQVSAESIIFRETPETVATQIASGGGAVLMHCGEAIGSGRWVAVPGPAGRGMWMDVKRIGLLPDFRKLGFGADILAALEAVGREAGKAGAQLAIRADQPRLIGFYASFGYARADDVDLTTVNPRSSPPCGMRKTFKD